MGVERAYMKRESVMEGRGEGWVEGGEMMRGFGVDSGIGGWEERVDEGVGRGGEGRCLGW